MRCTCGSSDIDYQESSGHSVCCDCGRYVGIFVVNAFVHFKLSLESLKKMLSSIHWSSRMLVIDLM